MTRDIDKLTMDDVRVAKQRAVEARELRRGLSTIDFVLTQVSSEERLEAAKRHLKKIVGGSNAK